MSMFASQSQHAQMASESYVPAPIGALRHLVYCIVSYLISPKETLFQSNLRKALPTRPTLHLSSTDKSSKHESNIALSAGGGIVEMNFVDVSFRMPNA